jgi:NTE family protein
MDHILASCSIPAVYPWTEIGEDKYWDGAVLANTPLGAVVDLAGGDDVDIMVVMMTPWYDDPQEVHDQMVTVPADLVQALSLTLDWSLLASYRTALKLLKNYNDLVDAAEKLERAAEQTGDNTLLLKRPLMRRISMPTVIAPQKFMPLEWMIDYEEANHKHLFELGKADAERALQQRTQQ